MRANTVNLYTDPKSINFDSILHAHLSGSNFELCHLAPEFKLCNAK